MRLATLSRIGLAFTAVSLVWRRGAAGWKIIREHNSSVLIPPAQLAALRETAGH